MTHAPKSHAGATSLGEPRAADVAALCARFQPAEVKATMNALLVTLAKDVQEDKVPADMQRAMALAMVDVGVKPGMTRKEWDREVLAYIAAQPVRQELLDGLKVAFSGLAKSDGAKGGRP
jgi:hypothetical protein